MRLALRKRPEGPLSLKPVGDQAVLAELGTEIGEETSRRGMGLLPWFSPSLWRC